MFVFDCAGRNATRTTLQVATLNLQSIELDMLKLHVLVHGAFGAVRLVAAGNWAFEVALDFCCSSTMAFSLVIVVHGVLIDLRAPVQ